MRALGFVLLGLALVSLVAVVALRASTREHPTYVPYADPTRAAVSGRVVDESGDPVAGVAIGWQARVGAPGLFGGGVFESSSAGVTSAADGSFRLEGLAATDGHVVTAAEERFREGHTGSVLLRAGEDASELVLRVRDVPFARRIEGRVLRSDGTPAASVPVQARHENWHGMWQGIVVTDAAGAFEFVAPWAGGDCELTLVQDDGTELMVGTVPVGSRGLVLRGP